jgi:ferredoxin
VRVAVDRTICRNHGQCTFAAPEVFRLDEAGTLVYVPDPDEPSRDAVAEAADVCPVQAIHIDD